MKLFWQAVCVDCWFVSMQLYFWCLVEPPIVSCTLTVWWSTTEPLISKSLPNVWSSLVFIWSANIFTDFLFWLLQYETITRRMTNQDYIQNRWTTSVNHLGVFPVVASLITTELRGSVFLLGALWQVDRRVFGMENCGMKTYTCYRAKFSRLPVWGVLIEKERFYRCGH